MLIKLLPFCRFETSRSSGPGGQHVNKTESKVTIFFSISNSDLNDEQKQRIRDKYKNKINAEDELILSSMASRSQLVNKEAAILKLRSLIESAIVPPKKRHKTKPTKGSIENRLDNKKRVSEKKKNRSKRDGV